MEYKQLTKKNSADPQSGTNCCPKLALATRAPLHQSGHHQQTIDNQGVGQLVQTKLKISQPGDIYEQEADRVADEVMRMPEPAATTEAAATEQLHVPQIQRLCTECEEEQAMRWPMEEEDEEAEQPIQMKEVSGRTAELSSAAQASVHNVTAGGQSLSESTRAFFEPRFGHDFRNVRIHTDQSAARSAESLKARAYTIGRNIVFGSGEFAPETATGRKLLTHELAHVVQQGGAARTISASRAQPDVTNTIQRQGDPLKEAAGEEKPKEEEPEDPIIEACGKACGSSPWVEVAPGRVVYICDDPPRMSGPVIKPVGCSPGAPGNVVFVSGAPAWDFNIPCSDCTMPPAPGSKPKPAPAIEIGYIQTVEKALSGGVYFQRNKSGAWDWAGNDWLCVKNARDGHATSTAPWYGPDASGNFGPVPFGQCPRMADNPFVKLPSHQKGNPLRRMRIDGVFNVWLIAQTPNKPPVFIHNWSIQGWVVAILKDDADPCNQTGWQTFDMKSLLSSGPGQGSATPVLTGATANTLKQSC